MKTDLSEHIVPHDQMDAGVSCVKVGEDSSYVPQKQVNRQAARELHFLETASA